MDWRPIIDTHAHIWPADAPNTTNIVLQDTLTVDEYLKKLDEYGVTFGVIAAPSFLGCYSDYMIAALRAHRRLRGTAIVDCDIEPHTLRRMDRDGVVGVRFALYSSPTIPDFNSPSYKIFFKRVKDLNWHVHVYATPERLGALIPVLAQTGVNLVIDHLAAPLAGEKTSPSVDAALRAVQNGRTWIKLSAPYRAKNADTVALVGRFLSEVGTDRLVWGSDCPWIGHEKEFDYGQAIGWFEAVVPDSCKRDQIGITAIKLYGFA